ncbi:MAG: protein kinase domain-containing protein [Ktedonobacterales bacterium]
MPQSASPATLAPGTVLTKRYRIEALIGSGGYASVYRATDLTFGYERAIKEVSDPDQGVRTQFRLEAELLINSKHPNIPHGYHLIEDMGRLFLVMDYVRGKDLEELLNESLTQKGRPLDEAQVLRWAIDICGALDEMHNLRVPVIHRDIKPANIKITPEGVPVLIDFGLAKLQQKGPTMTAAQGVSPGFAPPEQYMAKGRTDPRTDIYGLGATLYACLTGKDPPEAPGRLLAQTGAGGTQGMFLQPPRRLNSRISEEMDHIIVKSLELSPNNRQQSAHQMREELVVALQKLTGVFGDVTQAMGAVCARCGTQNRPEAVRCAHCGSLLRAPEGSQRSGGPPPLDLSAKRAAIGPAAAGRGLGKAAALSHGPVPESQRSGKQPAIAVDQRSGKQLAIAPDQRTGKQQAVAADQRAGKQQAIAADQRSGKQLAVSPGQQSGRHRAITPPPATAATVAAAAAAAQTTGTAVLPAVREGAIAPLPTRGQRGVAAPASQRGVAAPASQRGAKAGQLGQPAPASTSAKAAAGAKSPAEAEAKQSGAWIRLGTVRLTGFGKVMLALASIEALWGAIVLVLGIVAIVYYGQALPTQQMVIGWLIVVVLGSILGAQALGRPMYRRGRMTNLRRWLWGTAITLYSLAVQGAGIWGAYVFLNSQANAVPAIISYIAFGISALVAGIFGMLTALG